MSYRLICERTGEEIKVGDEVDTFRGDQVRVVGIRPPHRPGSSGRVIVDELSANGSRGQEYFPSVIDAKIVEDGADG